MGVSRINRKNKDLAGLELATTHLPRQVFKTLDKDKRHLVMANMAQAFWAKATITPRWNLEARTIGACEVIIDKTATKVVNASRRTPIRLGNRMPRRDVWKGNFRKRNTFTRVSFIKAPPIELAGIGRTRTKPQSVNAFFTKAVSRSNDKEIEPLVPETLSHLSTESTANAIVTPPRDMRYAS